jgi:hypothetical protein
MHLHASRRALVSEDVQQYPDFVGPASLLAPSGANGRYTVAVVVIAAAEVEITAAPAATVSANNARRRKRIPGGA